MVFEARGISSLGRQMWKDLVTFSELTTIVRTKGDPIFTEICHRARIGSHTEQDIELLKTRIISNELDVKHFMNEILIVYTNRECMEHNQRCTQYLNQQQRIIKVRAIDNFSEDFFNSTNRDISQFMSKDVNRTAGLPFEVEIGKGSRVMIRVNIDTAKKLVNGVVGTVKRIDLDTGNGIGSDVHVYSSKDVRKVYIKFDNDFVGEAKKHSCSHICKFHSELIGTVPIYSIEKEFLSNKNNRTWVKRYQFPFVLCWACTVHKVQGLTLNSAYINIIGNKKCCWQPGMFYTAISRLTSLDGLKFLHLDTAQIRTSSEVSKEYERLRSISAFKMERDLSCTKENNSLFEKIAGKLPSIRIVNVHKNPSVMSVTKNGPKTSRQIDYNTIRSDINEHDVSNSGRAFVIDFMGSSEAEYIANTLETIGFNVARHIVRIQEGNSCGYNAANVIAKLNACVEDGIDWCGVDVSNCCYLSSGISQQKEMIKQGTDYLENGCGSNPEFLEGIQCYSLIELYSKLYHNGDHQKILDDLIKYVFGPMTKTGTRDFLRSLGTKVSNYCVERDQSVLNFYISNKNDGEGEHFYVIAIEIARDRYQT